MPAQPGREDLLHLIEQEGGAELNCHFCNEKYHFTEADLRAILAARG